MSPRPRIKICCISSVEEAQAAIHAGADGRLDEDKLRRFFQALNAAD